MANFFLDSGTIGSGGQYDGSSTNTAWRTIERPLQGQDVWTGAGFSDTGGPVTGAGDIVWIYDGHVETWTSSDIIRIAVNGSSDSSNPVIYRADLAGSQAWGSAGGGSRPLITLSANNNCIFDDFSSHVNVRFESIDFVMPATGTQNPVTFFDIDDSQIEFVDCTFTGLYGKWRIVSGGLYSFEDCELDWYRDGTLYSNAMFQSIAGTVHIKRTTLGGGKYFYYSTTNRANILRCEDIVLDAPNTASGSTLVLGLTSGVGWDTNIEVNGITVHADWANYLTNVSNARTSLTATFMNWDNNPRTYKRYTLAGTITSSETGADLRAGGADMVTVCEPSAACTEWMGGLQVWSTHVWAPASQSRDYSVWLKLDDGAAGAWSGYPTAAELIFEVGYFDTASEVSRTWVQTTDVLSTDDYTKVTVSGINPAEDGLVEMRVILKTNDGGAGERLLVDHRPIVE